MPYLTKLLPLLAGAFFCFGHPSFISEHGFPLFPIIGLSLLFRHISLKDKKQDLISLFIFSAAINITAFYWIPQTITTFGRLPYPVSFFIFLLFSFIVTPFVWTSYLVLFNLKNLKIAKKLHSKPEALILLIAFILTLMEHFTPTQFPVRVGQSWMNLLATLGLAPIFGLPLYSFLTYQFSLSVAHYLRNKKTLKLNTFVPIILILIGIFIRPLTFQEKTLNAKEPNFHIRLVQANIGNYMKVQSELGQFNSLQEVYNRYFSLSMTDTELPLDLIVWPETSFPDDLNTDILEDNPTGLPPIFRNIIAKQETEMLVGGYDTGKLSLSKNGLETVYNSAFHFDEKGDYLNVYHKHQLIPFGETLPFGPITPYLKDHVPGVSFFSKDEIHTIFKTKKGFRFVVPICYELLSPHHIRAALKTGTDLNQHPHMIINLTNDSWYGKTAEPYQHLFLAKWRALEFQVPVVRSTNSGITSVFDIDGEESQRLTLGEVKHLDLNLFLPERTATLYQKYGLLNLAILVILLLVLSLWINRKSS